MPKISWCLRKSGWGYRGFATYRYICLIQVFNLEMKWTRFSNTSTCMFINIYWYINICFFNSVFIVQYRYSLQYLFFFLEKLKLICLYIWRNVCRYEYSCIFFFLSLYVHPYDDVVPRKVLYISGFFFLFRLIPGRCVKFCDTSEM